MKLFAPPCVDRGLRRLCRPPLQKTRTPFFQAATRAASVLGLAIPLSLVGAQAAHAGTIGINLALQNGWTNAPFATHNASMTSDGVVISFSGAIATAGTNPVVFTLPPSYRPQKEVYVDVDLCDSKTGRLHIVPAGTVTVETASGTFSDASCFTSLDGASFARLPTGFTDLTLLNGWKNGAFPTANAGVRAFNGVVQFRGAISSGTDALAFTLPVELRPAADAYVAADLCNAQEGRLHIRAADGAVLVETLAGAFADAQCFTSLEGASYALGTLATPLTLNNGWINAPFGTRDAAVENLQGMIRFEGAISTNGNKPSPFTLPKSLRPAATVYVPVDLCNAHGGRLRVDPSGKVTVQTKAGEFPEAQCFTSLDGVWFTLGGYAPLALRNGWTPSPFATNTPSAANQFGTVILRGAMATAGTNPEAFTLPVALRPAKDVYVATDLCQAHKGRLHILPNGVVTVEAPEGFADAQCFTSLDGVSFAPVATGYTKLKLKNGWTGAPFSTSPPAVQLVLGDENIVTFRGAIAGGSPGLAFTLPAALRPATDVYVQVGLCDASTGRLQIEPSGDVFVEAEISFADAQCFTSLDGVSFILSNPLVPLTLKNGWTNSPFGTRPAAAKNLIGTVRFSGAIAGGTTSTLFTLPPDQRPTANAFVPIDLCNGAKGRLNIAPNGNVQVQTDESDFSKAQCFTSLEGAWFVQ